MVADLLPEAKDEEFKRTLSGLFGMEALLDKPLILLSSGELRKFQLTRTLLARPAVLIMDNPFAQTNAEHLLKPLMEMAKKTNTQLICLSGLGGDSIYNRFDNIYVLKLMDSSIRSGAWRMEASHIKGEPVKRMVLSEFRVEERY